MANWKIILLLITVNLINFSESSENFRLPRNVIPYHYKIEILTDLDNDFMYKGKVSIDLKALESTNYIVLHSKNLEIFENETKLEEVPNASETGGKFFFDRLKRNSVKYEDEINSTSENNLGLTFASNDFQPPETTTPQSPATSFWSTTKSDVELKTSSSPFVKSTESVKEINEEIFVVDEESSKPLGSFEEEPITFTSAMITSAQPETTTGTSEIMSDEKYTVGPYEYHVENDFLKIYFKKPLVQDKRYRIEIKYQGILADTLIGFHRVPYVKKASQKSIWLASTVFEPSEARTAFPCFDEPDLKATFDVILGHDKKYTALSNMPLKNAISVEEKPEWQWSIFQTTPPMSTYLVAFLISDLEYLSPRQDSSQPDKNTTFRFWSRHEVLYKTRYAMSIAPKMKYYLEDLFQVQDVLPKHDFVALPSFISTALENWGLYSFAEKNLLYTSGFSSIFSKFQITQVLAHEVAHMWFGNMVTPKWWDQVWLSEGFANFFEIIAADHVQPNWSLKTTSMIYAYLKVFSLDALQSSHPLVPVFNEPKDVNEIFDSISYQKGLYLIRMLNYTLGEEAFMKGVRKYLKTNLFSNVDEDDLWNALDEFAHQEYSFPRQYHLKEIMHNWTRKAGYPVVEITRDYNNNTATVTQKRFLRFKGDYELRNNLHRFDKDDTKWWVPLTYTTGLEVNFKDTKPKFWLNPSEESMLLTDMPSKNDFVLMNLDAAGLYRVKYDDRNWNLIISYLLYENHEDISVLNRVQILDDLFDLARSGDVTYNMVLEATEYLKKEKHFLPWKAALSNFDFIGRMFRSKENNRTLKKFLRHLISPRFEELGVEVVKNETFSDSMNRKQIATWACRTGLRQCTRKSISFFKKWMQEKRPDENNPIPSSLRSVVYCSAIENGGSKEWQFLWQRYLSNALTDKTAALQGLACSRNTRTLKKYLDWSLRESSGIRKQDAPAVFKAVARNDIGFYLAKNFLRERLSDMRRYLGNDPFFLPQMIETLASKMNQPSDLQNLEDIEQESFSKFRLAPGCFRQAIERVQFNIHWTEKNYQFITDWLKRQKF